MAIEKKLIHFGKLADFEAQLTAGNILDYSIVFIQDAKKIWTHGTYYDCTEGGASGDSLWHEDSEGNAFCDRDIRVDGNVLTNGTVVTGSIGVPLEEGGFVTGDKGQILRANGDGSIGWDDISIPTKVSQLENDRNFVDEQTLSKYVKKETLAGLDTAQASAISGGGMLYALPDQANGGEDDILLSRDSVKTINGESIVGSGDITIEGGSLTESDIAAMGFTKNTGTYSKPSGGIPKSDLASAVQTSLGKADTALQSYTEQYKGTITGVSANGTSVATSGVANIPAASISAYGVTKLSSAINSTSTTLAATASAVKAAYDLASGKASMSDVNTAIANAITTTLNTAV